MIGPQTIPATSLLVKADTINTISGNINSNITLPATLASYQSIALPVVFMERERGNNGLLT